jgi:hypothetical protein
MGARLKILGRRTLFQERRNHQGKELQAGFTLSPHRPSCAWLRDLSPLAGARKDYREPLALCSIHILLAKRIFVNCHMAKQCKVKEPRLAAPTGLIHARQTLRLSRPFEHHQNTLAIALRKYHTPLPTEQIHSLSLSSGHRDYDGAI